MKARISLLGALVLAAGLAGCEQAMRDMYEQPKYRPFAPSPLFPDGRSARPLVPGTVPRAAGTFADASSGRADVAPLPEEPPVVYPIVAPQARDSAPTPWRPNLQELPVAVTKQVLERGQERFDIFCAPCHSPAGDGDGMVARRGFPPPPSFHTDRLRHAPAKHFYDVITAGYGAMYPYASRVPTADRWAIVAYIRALQFSQYAMASVFDDDTRRRVEAAQ